MYDDNFNFPFNPHIPEFKIIIQLLTYIVENCDGRIEKQKLYYLMFLTDYISIMHQGKFLSKDFYYFDLSYGEESPDIVDIFMYNGEQILNADIPNGYIVESEDGYVNLLKKHSPEYVDPDYECIYLDEMLKNFSHFSVDELAAICSSFNVFELGEMLTQKSIIWNDNIHELLVPYTKNAHIIRDQHAMSGDYM